MILTTSRRWMVAAGVAGLAACIDGFDSFNGADEAYYRLFDYVIDRPRVLAVTYWPPYVAGGEVVTLRALAATPDDLVSPKVSWWGCGVSLDVPFVYYGADCMQTSLAEFLGTGPVLSLQLPYYDLSACEASGGCNGYLPIVAVVESRDGESMGQGITFLSPDYLDRAPEPRIDAETWNDTIRLWIDGTAGAPVTAAPGEPVGLEAVVPSTETDHEFSWYTSEGTFTDYGVTRAAAVVSGQGEGLNLIHGRNTLVVPDHPSSTSIQVYVVATPVSAIHPALTRFATGTIEVSP